MPAVEDADGNRMGVAAGPVNLGQVPIVQRSVQPGQRITLGYPWFRIRPAGWRGEVLGPTCCAAPGRYKVGYAGLPLRLGDDKADMSGPATGQVELDIRGGETVEPDRTAKDRVAPALAKSSARSENGSILYINCRDFKIPTRIPSAMRGRIRSVRLYVSRDGGQSFLRAQDTRWRDGQTTVNDFIFNAPEDGVYDFVIQTDDEQGHQEPNDIMKVRPQLTVCVDTTPPAVELREIDSGKGSAGVRWKVSDQNLDLSTLELLYRPRNEKAWNEARIKPAAEGMYEWDDRLDGVELEVHLRVRDKAGNYSAVVGHFEPRKRE